MALMPSTAAWPASSFHDLHVSYGNLAVEGPVAVLRLRFFKDDLELALAEATGATAFRMAATPEVDRVFLDYFRSHFTLEVAGVVLAPRIIASSEDAIDREPVWSYALRFDAPAPIEAMRIHNDALFEIYRDQRNVLRVTRFPDGSPRAYYFAPGEADVEVRFDAE